MKIAVVGPIYPYRGGIANFNARLIKELKLVDELLSINFSRLYPGILFPGKTQYDTSQSTFDVPSERLIDSINPFSWFSSASHINQWKPDAVIFHYWHPFFIPSYVSIIKALTHVPCIAICHNVVPHESAGYQKWMIRQFLERLDGVMVHAQAEAEDLKRLQSSLPNKVGFHPLYDNFPNQDISKRDARERLGLPVEGKIALYFGLIRHYKGVDLFFQASDLLQDSPDLKMLAVGEIYAGREELTAQVASLPFERAELRDTYIPNELVALYFRAADLVVLPYRTATQSGIVPIAYACDRPVVVTQVGGLSEVVNDGETGFVIPPNDVQALADAIRSFFANNQYDRFQPGINRVKSRLSWKTYCEQLHELIVEVK